MNFYSELTVRIGDINYGQHLAHDRLITLLHQARLDLFQQISASCNEMSFFGVGLIMRRLEIDYLGEAFLNDVLRIEMRLDAIKKARFDVLYQVFKAEQFIATARTQMVAFDYATRRVQALPPAFFTYLSSQS